MGRAARQNTTGRLGVVKAFRLWLALLLWPCPFRVEHDTDDVIQKMSQAREGRYLFTLTITSLPK